MLAFRIVRLDRAPVLASELPMTVDNFEDANC
jgi:hypothetical protein